MGYENIKKRMIESEGNVTHMYLDTKGKVTVGIGAMLPDVNAAKKLGFVTKDKKLKAALKQIEEDYKAVKKQPKGKIASAYKKYTKLEFPERKIDALPNPTFALFSD